MNTFCGSTYKNKVMKILKSEPIIYRNNPLEFSIDRDTLFKIFYKEYIIFQLDKVRELKTNLNIKGSESYFVYKKNQKKGTAIFSKMLFSLKNKIATQDSIIGSFAFFNWVNDDTKLFKHYLLKNFDKKNNSQFYNAIDTTSKNTVEIVLSKELLSFQDYQFPYFKEKYKTGIKKIEVINFVENKKLAIEYEFNIESFDSKRISIYDSLIKIHDSLMLNEKY